LAAESAQSESTKVLPNLADFALDVQVPTDKSPHPEVGQLVLPFDVDFRKLGYQFPKNWNLVVDKN
jgi:hypothetical protein